MYPTYDAGQEIAGAAFGGSVSARRRRRHARALKTMKKEIVELFPGRVFGKKEVTTKLPKTTRSKSSIRARVKIPVLNTFTLCFWIRTKDDFAQIFAIIYNNSKNRARIDVSIRRGHLVLNLDGKQR